MLKKNKSIALVMILALLIITSSCAPKNTQAEIDKPAKTSASWERKLCRSKLDIISSYGDDQAFHPKVLNFEKPWNGYRYWICLLYTSHSYTVPLYHFLLLCILVCRTDLFSFSS